jgi:hypothetical protein
MTDQELVLTALRQAGEIIAEYLQPGPRDAEKTMLRMIATLDTQQLAAATARLEQGYGIKIVK